MANPEKVERAFFKIEGSNQQIDVDFNPESLQYTITNNLANKGEGNETKQYVSDSTGKLVMDLIFDTTGTGEDVRLKTVKIAKLMEPIDTTPPVVNFEWGLYTFKGMLESYKETIDYFSANGVPLRASVNISMSSQDQVFEGGSEASNAGTGGSAGLPNSTIPATSNNGKGATDVATKAGNPSAGKSIAINNGLENMRFPGKSSLEIGGSAPIKAPAAFSGGLDINSGVDLDLGARANGNSDVFSRLHTVTAELGVSASLNLDNFLNTDITSHFGVDNQAPFELGGSAGLQGSASLITEVGQGGELKAKIEFDGG